MRLDGAEVKLSLGADQTARALQALHLADRAPWHVFFVEDVTAGLCSSTPLLDQHVIVRARQKTKGKDDVTLKFRPGRRSQLSDRWLGTTKTTDGDLKSELKVEEDWAGERRMLALSLTAERPDGLVAVVAAGELGIGDLLTDEQQQLIADCSGISVNLSTLSVLPPLTAMRWPTFAVPGPASDLDVRAERWTVEDLDFLELSIAVDVDVAEASQAALVAFVERKGLSAGLPEAKTSLVLQRLVARAAC